MKKQIVISGVAIGQWRNSTNKGLLLSKKETEDKIKRAIILGKPMFMYKSGDYIVKYYDLNILVSSSGIVLTVWRHHDQNTYVKISENAKNNLKSGLLDIKSLAYAKHELILGGEFNMQRQGDGFK